MGDKGWAMVGHHGRTGLDESVPAKSWNSSQPSHPSHRSRGFSLDPLKPTGGAGLYGGFAAD